MSNILICFSIKRPPIELCNPPKFVPANSLFELLTCRLREIFFPNKFSRTQYLGIFLFLWRIGFGLRQWRLYFPISRQKCLILEAVNAGLFFSQDERRQECNTTPSPTPKATRKGEIPAYAFIDLFSTLVQVFALVTRNEFARWSVKFVSRNKTARSAERTYRESPQR
jgi:hypothetical protein